MEIAHRHKIIFVSSAIADNINTVRYQLARLFAQNYQVSLICSTDNIPASIRELCQKFYGIKHKMLFFILCPLLILYLGIFKENKVICTGNNLIHIFLGYMAKRIFGVKWIYCLWDHPSLEFDGKPSLVKKIKRVIFEKILKQKLLSADVWLVGMNNGILHHLPNRSTAIVKYTNGIELDYIDTVVSNTLPACEDSNTILDVCYTGWVTMERGMALIMEFLSSFEGADRIRFCSLGKTNKETMKVIERFNRNNLTKINYKGFLNHQQSLLKISKCDVGICILSMDVLNYRYAYPIKIFEYLGMGKIVVATRTPAMEEIITDGENGFLIENNVETMSKVFDTIIELKQTGNLEKMSRAARESAERFDWKKITVKIVLELNDYL